MSTASEPRLKAYVDEQVRRFPPLTENQKARITELLDPTRDVEPPRAKRSRKAAPRTALYRHFDSDGVLLYVGISNTLETRTSSHAHRSTWGTFANDATIAWFDGREERAEASAIEVERPLFNKAGNHDPERERRVIEYLMTHDRADLVRAAL